MTTTTPGPASLREAFEKWYRGTFQAMQLEWHQGESYELAVAWAAWQASAAQRGQPVAWGAFYVDKCVNAYTTLKEARVDYPLDLATSCELRPLYAAPPPAQGAPRE